MRKEQTITKCKITLLNRNKEKNIVEGDSTILPIIMSYIRYMFHLSYKIWPTSGGATFSPGCFQEHPNLEKKKYIYIYNN